MQVAESRGRLYDLNDFVFDRQLSMLSHDIAKLATIHVFHHQIMYAIRFASVVGGDDVMMTQLCCGQDFLMEALNGKF